MKELAFLAPKEERINYGGLEMMIRLGEWVYWYKKNCAKTWWKPEGVTESWPLEWCL